MGKCCGWIFHIDSGFSYHLQHMGNHKNLLNKKLYDSIVNGDTHVGVPHHLHMVDCAVLEDEVMSSSEVFVTFLVVGLFIFFFIGSLPLLTVV